MHLEKIHLEPSTSVFGTLGSRHLLSDMPTIWTLHAEEYLEPNTSVFGTQDLRHLLSEMLIWNLTPWRIFIWNRAPLYLERWICDTS